MLPSVLPSQRSKVWLVATRQRWAALSLAGLVLALFFTVVFIRTSHSKLSWWALAPYVLGASALLSGIVSLQLRAEEARVARELRIARTGTSVTRGIVLRRRQAAPAFLRLLSVPFGQAALLLANDDRDAAVAALAAGSPMMAGGGINLLRAIVEADIQRASGSAAGLAVCIELLRKVEPSGHRELDLYRIHVLVRAILEHGDSETAELFHREFVTASDDEVRVYGVWLRAWFDLEAEPPIEEGIVRMALLLARSHGAEALVERFEEAFRTREQSAQS